MPGPPPSDYTGYVYGRLTVTGRDSKRKHYLCDCTCGTKGKSVRQDLLRQGRVGRVVSCGCRKREHCSTNREAILKSIKRDPSGP